jgi:DNA-binding FrmR family transcriptional regulator
MIAPNLQPSTSTDKDKIIVQLKRIRGQLDGIINMYADERACVDIVRQVIAARNSLGRVAQDLLTNEASRCSKERKVEELQLILKELFKY